MVYLEELPKDIGGNKMRRKIIGFLICSLLITTILPITVSSDYSSNNIIYVDDDATSDWYDSNHVQTIQEGIDVASDGDTVFVYSGTYYENLSIEKSICLKGENKETTIIDGGNLKRVKVIDINCNNVTVKRFSIIHGSIGVDATKVDNITITGNIIKHNRGLGLDFHRSNCNTITYNIISENGINSSYGAAIHFFYSNNNNISGNIVNNNFNNGVSIAPSYNSTISGNSITNNFGVGLQLQYSYNNIIVRNNFIENGQKTEAFLWLNLADNAMFLCALLSGEPFPFNNRWDKNLGSRSDISKTDIWYILADISSDI